MKHDALLLISFGGPECREDVIPFLQNVLRGRNVPEARMLEVAEHYYHFEGISPINQQNRDLIAALEANFADNGLNLPIYWGNRNWDPYLVDTLAQMKQDGIQNALALVTSAFSSYSGCRQYRENILAAQEAVGDVVPLVHKLRMFYNHPGFVETMADHVREALERLPSAYRENALVIYTAHSIPTSMADRCKYVSQLNESCRLVSDALGRTGDALAYQSRSGPPTQPWLEPDILTYLRQVKAEAVYSAVVIAPIGFVSDHMEVLYDLDTEAHDLCNELGLPMERAATPGTHPAFVTMIRQLVEERMSDAPERLSLGSQGPSHDVCPLDCCPAPSRQV